MRQKTRTSLVWVLLVLVFVLLYRLTAEPDRESRPFPSFVQDVAAGEVALVHVEPDGFGVELRDGTRYVSHGVVDQDIIEKLDEAGVALAWGAEDHSSALRSVLLVGVPLLVLLILFVYFVKKGMAGGGSANILSLRKSRARLIADSKVTFADVGGCAHAKEQLCDVIDFLKAPEHWSRAGVRLPRGILLEGPPGCGKTLLARAVAGETDAKFYLVSASEFVEMFVGVGAARVRDMFETAAKAAPAVIFIDELDAVGRRRGSGVGAAHDEREQTLNQILVCLDGFESHDRVVVVAATNRADILDAALLRPGRFDRRIAIPDLDASQREQVLEIHTRSKKLADDVSLGDVALRAAGWSGAQLEALANEAGLLAVRRARRDGDEQAVLRSQDFEQAMRPGADARPRFDRVDSLLIESTTQLSQSTGRAVVRVSLLEGTQIRGELVWADAGFLKVRADDGSSVIVPKSMVKTLEAIEGTEWAGDGDVAPDPFAGRTPGLA